MSLRASLFVVLVAGCSASTSAAPSANSDAGTNAPLSCDGYERSAATTYTKPTARIERFPAVIDATLDPAADTMPYTLVLSEPAEVQVRITMSIAGAGGSLLGLARSVEKGDGTTQTWVLGPGILPAGEHTLSISPGKTGTGPFRVEVEAFGARARKCDSAFVDPGAGVTDVLATNECTEALKRGLCGIVDLVDNAENRSRYCKTPDAPCLRAAREYLSCLVTRGTCDGDAGSIEGLQLHSDTCAVHADVCP